MSRWECEWSVLSHGAVPGALEHGVVAAPTESALGGDTTEDAPTRVSEQRPMHGLDV